MLRYGIFGGTFDPCTYAHYEIAKKVLKDKLVDRVIVIPTIVDYYRKDKHRMFTNEQRLAIIKKWFDDCENVIIDDSEYKLITNVNDYHYKYEDRRYWHTLQDVMRKFGYDNDYLTIIGADSWNNITSWFNFRKLGQATKFIVVSRATQPVNFYINYPEYHSQPYKVIELDEKLSKVSATELRKYLVDECSYMNMGSQLETIVNVYMEEIENYKETGMTYIDREVTYDKTEKVAEDIVSTEKLLAHTPIFDLVESAEVEAGFKPVKIIAPDWVSIVVEKDGKFLMTKQLRYGLRKEFEEFPCGMVEAGEDAIEAGMRELEEETGIKVKDMRCVHYMGKFAANPAFMNNYMHYLHVNLNYALYDEVETKFDEHEHLTSCWIEKKNAFENFVKSNGSAIMGAAWMLLMKKKII